MEDYQIQIITAFLAFIAGWGLSLVNDRRHKLQHIKDAYNSLIHELNEEKTTLDELTNKSFSIDKNGNTQVEHMSIGISRYESIVYSGMFRELDHDIQNMASEVYGKIKNVNHMSYRLLEILTDKSGTVDTNFINNLKKFGENIDEQIVTIKNEIPKLIKLIEERMPTSSI